MSRLTAHMGDKSYSIFHKSVGGLAISNENAFENRTSSDRNSLETASSEHDFSAEIDDMPFLSLSVDGLTNYSESRGGRVDLCPADAAANDASSMASENRFINAEPGRDANRDIANEPMKGTWGKVKTYFGF